MLSLTMLFAVFITAVTCALAYLIHKDGETISVPELRTSPWPVLAGGLLIAAMVAGSGWVRWTW